MLSVGVQQIALGLAVSLNTVRNLAKRPDWPAPTLRAVRGTGRPEAQWLVRDLPVAISIKGRAVPVREVVKEALVQRIISEGNHEKTGIEESRPRQIDGASNQGGSIDTGNAGNTKSSATGAVARKGIFRADLSQSNAQPAQSVQNSMALASPGRIHGAVSPVLSQVGALKDWQKRIAEARGGLLREVERIAAVLGREGAIMKMVYMVADGTLAPHLAALVPVANARSGKDGKRTLSRRTLYTWIGDAAMAAAPNQAVNALAPKDAHAVAKVPAWGLDCLTLNAQPQGKSIQWVCDKLPTLLATKGIPAPSYGQIRRFLGNMGNVEREVGRMGSRQIKNIKGFVRRDTSGMWPGDAYTADGHCFDAEIAHPKHGKPFRPEITCVLDIATRRAVGWSIDLAESGLAVLDALRSAVETGGIPSLFYVDNGSGYHNTLMSAPGVGMETRLGFTMTHSIAYNSQARGIIERSHQSIWVKAAKELPTYIGAAMDAQAKQVVHKLTRKDVKAGGKSKFLMDFPDFVRFCEIRVAAYNAHPHSSLPKIWDDALGKKRHMSPDEAWAAGVAEGAQLVMISPEESRDLFRPQREVKVLRCEIKLFSNQYYSKNLQEYHGDIVRVGYDVRNADKVWVYDNSGRFICEAGFEANKRAYFPQTFLEEAAQKRAKGRERLLNIRLDEVQAELEGTAPTTISDAPVALENNPSPRLIFTGLEPDAPMTVASEAAETLVTVAEVAVAPEKRPLFLVDSEHYEWLMARRGSWNLNDARFLRRYLDESDGYAQLADRFALLDIAWSDAEEAMLNHFFNAAAYEEHAA